MATLTPEAQEIFGATYKVPEEIWLKVHFTTRKQPGCRPRIPQALPPPH